MTWKIGRAFVRSTSLHRNPIIARESSSFARCRSPVPIGFKILCKLRHPSTPQAAVVWRILGLEAECFLDPGCSVPFNLFQRLAARDTLPSATCLR